MRHSRPSCFAISFAADLVMHDLESACCRGYSHNSRILESQRSSMALLRFDHRDGILQMDALHGVRESGGSAGHASSVVSSQQRLEVVQGSLLGRQLSILA